jgi:hypothetical protein
MAQNTADETPLDSMEWQTMTLTGARVRVSVWPSGAGPVHIDTADCYTPKHAAQQFSGGSLDGGDC